MAEEKVLALPSDGQQAEKAISPQVLEHSVIEAPQAGAMPTSLATSLLWFAGQAADEITPWGRDTKLRDRQLREFFPAESTFASALGVVTARNQAFRWVVEGPPIVATRTQKMLEEADQGQGWEHFIATVSQDIYTQDYGAFVELVRLVDRPDSPVIGINHLDAARCWHTGDPLAPVIYQDRKGVFHRLNWWNVYTLAELPTAIEELPGLQICALSRMLRAAQIIKNVTIYQMEKTGGRHTRALHLVKGISSLQINDALEQMRAKWDAMGLLRYTNPLVVGSVDPKAEIDIKTLELASLPDGWDEEKVFKQYITIIAMAFLTDYQEFAPLPGGGLGTSTQSEILHLKSKGKGPALFMKLIRAMMNNAVLPQTVEFNWEEQDVEAEKEEAEVQKLRAETRKVRIDSGEITPAIARQIAVDNGDMSQEMFDAQGEIDLTTDIEVAGAAQPPHSSEHEDERIEEGAKGVSLLPVPFGEGEEKVLTVGGGPFEDERAKDERGFLRAIRKGLEAVGKNVEKKLKQERVGQKDIPNVPDDFAFWNKQGEVFLEEVGTWPTDLLRKGAGQASKLGLAVSFDLVNQQVLDLAGEYSNAWWAGLQNTTQKGLRRAIQNNIATGQGHRALVKEIEPLFGKARAEAIASTETTRLYAEGNRAAYADAGVEMVEWQTVMDSLVDPLCEELDGQQWPIGQEEFVPPRHVRCRCLTDNQIFVYTVKGKVRFRDLRVGDLVLTHKGRFRPITEILTNRNDTRRKVKLFVKQKNRFWGRHALKRLPVTEDHPVWTPTGWKEVRDLKIGESVYLAGKTCTVCEEISAAIDRVVANDHHEYGLVEAEVVEVRETHISSRASRVTYNLEVAEDQSFVAAGFVIHNCWLSPVVDGKPLTTPVVAEPPPKWASDAATEFGGADSVSDIDAAWLRMFRAHPSVFTSEARATARAWEWSSTKDLAQGWKVSVAERLGVDPNRMWSIKNLGMPEAADIVSARQLDLAAKKTFQAWAKQEGITEIKLFRGFRLSPGDALPKVGSKYNLPVDSISSWTSNEAMARDFATTFRGDSPGLIVSRVVKVEDIAANVKMIGMASQTEVVVESSTLSLETIVEVVTGG